MKKLFARRQTLVLTLAETVLLAGFALAMAWLWDRWLIPGPHGLVRWVGMDFVPYWTGIRAMLSGQSPYSPTTTQAIQSLLLGGPPEAGGDPMLFVYPAWLFLPLLPWALLPLRWAVALWTGLLLSGALHLIGFLALRWGGGHRRAVAFWALILAIGSLPFLVISVTKGQLGLIGLGALLLINQLWKRHETSAGIILGLALLKPTLVIVPVLGFLILGIIERKYRFLGAFLACVAVLFASSWLAVGNWIPDYLTLLHTAGGAPVLWSLALLPGAWKWLYAAFFAGVLVYAFIMLWRKRDQPQWFSATILAGLALFPMRWVYDLLLGILVPLEARGISRSLGASIALALLAPWGLALFPASTRWSALVIGLPIAWGIVWLVQFIPKTRAKQGA